LFFDLWDLISIYVYKKKGPVREFSDDFIPEIMVNKSEKECMKFSKARLL